MNPTLPIPHRDDRKLSYRSYSRLVRAANEKLMFDGASFEEFRGGGKRLIKARTGAGGAALDWEQFDFGHVLNPPIHAGNQWPPYPLKMSTDYPYVGVFDGLVNGINCTGTAYVKPYLRRGNTFALRKGEQCVFTYQPYVPAANTYDNTPQLACGPAEWDESYESFTVNSLYSNPLDGSDDATTEIAEGSKVHVLYKFTVKSTDDLPEPPPHPVPPKLYVDESLTVVCRMMDIEDPRSGEDMLPDGTASKPHLVWNHVLGLWQIGLIVPDGTADHPHLIWNPSTAHWEAGRLFTLPEGGDTPCVAIWSPFEDNWIALSMESTPYTYLGVDTGGNPIIDYVRWT